MPQSIIIEYMKGCLLFSTYRGNDGLLMDQLRGFHVPDHILVKMKRFMTESRTDEDATREGTPALGDDDAASSDTAE